MAEKYKFTEKTKQIIAGRAGYLCSKPDCNKLTIGPAKGSSGYTLFGEAAHIYSSAENGPRGRGALNEDEINHESNGIWLCPSCHTKIDKEKGDNYSPEQLQTYKDLHEIIIYNKIHGFFVPIFYINRLNIKENSYHFKESTIDFSKFNIITGSNGTGKSLLCELITGAFNFSFYSRCKIFNFNYDIQFFNPNKHEININIENENIRIDESNKSLLINPYALKIMKIDKLGGDLGTIPSTDEPSLIHFSLKLNIEKELIRQWIEHGSIESGLIVKKVKIDDKDWVHVQTIKTMEDNKWMRYENLSAGEKITFILDMAISICIFLSTYQNIFLCIDSEDFNILDNAKKDHYYKLLAQTEGLFQSIIVIPLEKPLSIYGVRSIHLRRENNYIIVE